MGVISTQKSNVIQTWNMKKYDMWTLKYETNQPQGIKMKEIVTYNNNWISKFGNDTHRGKQRLSIWCRRVTVKSFWLYHLYSLKYRDKYLLIKWINVLFSVLGHENSETLFSQWCITTQSRNKLEFCIWCFVFVTEATTQFNILRYLHYLLDFPLHWRLQHLHPPEQKQ